MKHNKLTPGEVHEVYSSPRIRLARTLEDDEARDAAEAKPESTASKKIKALQVRVAALAKAYRAEKETRAKLKECLSRAHDNLRRLQGEEFE